MPEQSAGGGCPPLSLLEKAARVMNAFSAADARLTLTEVVQRSGVPRSSAHRILDQLLGLRWLEREGRGYRLGLGVLELGALAAHHHRLRRAALPHLHELHEATGHLVHLAVLDEAEVVHVERIGGAADTAVPTRVGGRQPAYCTASGKAILAFGDDAVVEQVVRGGLRPRTPRTICRPEALRSELAAARARGVAYDHEEAYRGVSCVAAPLRGAGRAIGAISLSGNGAHRELDRLAPAVADCARTVWRALFGPGRRTARPHRATEVPRPGPVLSPAAMANTLAWLRDSEWV
ncbi:IclR family transcriptional regulator [Streptomyces sp. RS10V-4]|uniref:IclR family transcriptional regulator n=1 Tax=Streptomyces rhizoryzae TaxID=2932493 RepID=UPI002004BF40|nr:IclR family transcriptional regulator [Streptomyces rhizoryzae]MCK7622650.1 IclR family transcriptional regulator [Streptomyces rhizoryzae]